MSDNSVCRRINRISVCPLSSKGRRMKSQELFYRDEQLSEYKGEQVYVVKSYSDRRNSASLTFLEGDLITVLERFSDGMCRGYLSRLGPHSNTGIFPTTCVVPFTKNNINSFNPGNIDKFYKKRNDTVNIVSMTKDLPMKENMENSHMYSCNCIEIRKSPNKNDKVSQTMEPINRGSTYSVDSGRGSSNVAVVNNIKTGEPLSPASDHTQQNPENYSSRSIESGLASYQRHSSSSNSSIGGDSTTEGSKQNVGFTNNEHQRHMLSSLIDDENGDENIIKNWLRRMNLEMYSFNFIDSGYDFKTVLRMTPEDLNAIGITNPKHRKQIKEDISLNNVSSKGRHLESIPVTLDEWLTDLNLLQYRDLILRQGYDSIEKIAELTWEDLEDIGIKKLGHQKKILLAIEKLKKVIKITSADKFPISYSAENFRNHTSISTISDTCHYYKIPQESQFNSPSNLDMSKYYTTNYECPSMTLSQLSDNCLLTTINPLFSPPQTGWQNPFDTALPPPTPKRISSTISSSREENFSATKLAHRKPYENIDESIVIPRHMVNTQSSNNDSQIIHRVRDCSGIPFANENCGTIKQRSSSLDRTNILKDKLEYGVLNLKTNIVSSAKSVLPLNLPYSIDSQSHKALNSISKLKVNIHKERSIQIIPSDVHVAARERVPMPKLHIDNSSSSEDFNDICDMLEDLTELLDKETSRNH